MQTAPKPSTGKLPATIEPEATVSMVIKKSYFRCACGSDVELEAARGTCHECGRVVSLAALNASQTLSFISDGSGSLSSITPCSESHLGGDRSGERLGHFRLVSMLGQGGMGVVYRALDESLQRFVAVKVMRCSSSEGSTAERVIRLLDEAVAQARLNHPHVVTIYYVGRDAADPFFAMELLPGPTLDKLLQDGPLPYAKVIRYARQVTSALAHATQLSLVHGDIKPSNLILTGDGCVKLGDFGLAFTDQKASVGISGTLSYMAPELAEGSSPTAQSDMYALGVTLFELSFGRRPYSLSGQTLTDQLLSHRSAEIEFPQKWPSDIPERWKYLLQRLLAKNPEDRYPDYASLDRDLASIAPVGVTMAGRINRAIAYMVDFIPQVFMVLIIGIPTTEAFAGVNPLEGSTVGWLRLIGIFALLVPAAVAWGEWYGWSTPGRYLMQLRVVDKHGLPLTRQKRLLRSILRNLPIWAAATQTAILALGLFRVGILLGFMDEILLIVNALPVLGSKRKAMHDRIVGSHVVLDTTR